MGYEPLPKFGGWAGPRNPKLLIVGEAWGEDEYQTREPFVGSSGRLLWEMLGKALPDVEPELHSRSMFESYRLGNAWIRGRCKWLEAAGIAYTNVLNLRPLGNKLESVCCDKRGLEPGYDLPRMGIAGYLRPEYLPEVQRLFEEVSEARPNCILAAGNTACWAFLRSTNIGSIRGTVAHSVTIPRVKVLPAYHPAAILRQYNWYPITVADIIKAYREAGFPDLIRPERYVVINPTMKEVKDWMHALRDADLVAVDIETHWKQISCIGFAPSSRDAIVVPFIVPGKPPHYWDTLEEEVQVWQLVRGFLESPVPKLFQNGAYDIQYILKMGIQPANVQHDTMLLHHSLFPEMRKGLGFLASIYSNESAWKLMGRPKADTVKRDE